MNYPITFGLLVVVGVLQCSPLLAEGPQGGSLANSAAKRIVLASDGKPALPIVISAEASPVTRAVAKELADVLSRMTRASFKVVAGDGSVGIVLGTSSEFPHPELAEALKIRDGFDGKEAYAIRTEQGRLLLLGATDLGASHAAFRLLEEVGCRWFFPAKEWEVIPQRRELSVALDVIDRPAILARRIWYGGGFFDRDKTRPVDDYKSWARHNRMAMSMRVSCGHAWQSIIHENKKIFDAHPEYLALVKGKRSGEQLCVSNPELRKVATSWALTQLRRQPKADMVSLETSDGGGHCECEACRRMGSISDRAFGLANEVARTVAREHPGKMVGMLAYNDHCEPPSFALEPNVYVQLTAGFIRGESTFDELAERWPKHARSLGFYEYLSVWPWDFDMPARGRANNIKYLRTQIPRYAALGATSLDCESSNNWGPMGLGYYVANKLMWNPKADVDAIVDDFLNLAFGPAADPMRRYYARLDLGNEPLMSEHLLALALRDLAEASERAKDRPDVLARLNHLKQYQHYVRLRWDIDRTTDKDRRRELTLEALTHGYRTRYSYMNHWTAFFFDWTAKAAKAFNEPEWSYESKSGKKPWQVEASYTAEDTDKDFRSDMQRFHPHNVEEKSFSTKLRLGGFRSEKPAELSHAYQYGARYALAARDGKPLIARITTGVIPHYRDFPLAVYSVTDANGKEVLKGKLPQDGKEHILRIENPESGIYWLAFDDRMAGWAIKVDPGTPAVLALPRSKALIHLGQMRPAYFYVPQGTRQIQYHWDGPPHDVHGPDGKKLTQVTTRGGLVTVDVPANADGKPWSLHRLSPGHLWFFNLPNYLAASPDGLLVPEELAPAR